VSIDQQGVGHISANNTSFIYIDIIDIVNYVYPLPLRRVGWLHNPNVLLGVVLLQFLVVSIEVSKFIGEDIGVREEVEVLLAELLLHPHHVDAQTVFAGNLITLREVINLLVFIESFIEIGFAVGGTP
jgi:hypothetical protein